MRSLLSALGLLLASAVVAWAACVFVLRLPWETSLLVIELCAGAGAVAGWLLGRR